MENGVCDRGQPSKEVHVGASGIGLDLVREARDGGQVSKWW